MMRSMAMCVTYSREFRIFVESCRMGDSISVEYSINDWLTIWHDCSRKNYCKLAILQIENMYKNINYSHLQHLLMNMYVRLYKDGKGDHHWGRMLLTDYFCEMLNDWLRKILTPDNAETWRKMSYNQYYSYRDIESTYYDVKSSTKPDLIRQKCRIYELLAQVTKGKIVHNRSMDTHIFFKEIIN